RRPGGPEAVVLPRPGRVPQRTVSDPQTDVAGMPHPTAQEKTAAIVNHLFGRNTLEAEAQRLGIPRSDLQAWETAFFERVRREVRARPNRRRIEDDYREIQRTDLSDWERVFFVPMIAGQAEYLAEIFRWVKRTAERPEIAAQIAVPLSEVLRAPGRDR